MTEHVHTHGDAPPHAHEGATPGHTHDGPATTTAVPAVDPTAQPVATTATAPAAVEVGPSGGGIALRMALTVLGAAGMIVGAFLKWGAERIGTEVEFRAFFDTEAVGGPTVGFATSTGFALIVLGLLALLGMAFRTGWLTRLAGALGLVALVMLVITQYQADETLSFFQIGFWVCAAGSLVALIGGFLGSRPRIVATSVPA
ncbi:MAG: hypothetical protein ACRDH8_03430 [Actinomycetota bacterium]